MLVYLLKSALLLAILYGCFALLLSRETFHRFNRLALLFVLVASLVLPALQLTMNKPSFLVFGEDEIADSPPALPIREGAITLEDESLMFSEETAPSLIGRAGGESEESESSSALDWKQLLTLLYLAGVLASVGFFLIQLFRFLRETKDGTRTRDAEGNTVIIRDGDFPPYSFFHHIIISVSDYEHLQEPILAHEQAHIRLGHSWDLLLLEAVKAIQWFNPFVYLLGRDLKAVHEYEADNAVLNHGIDAKTYQLLLVTKAVGNRLQTLGNNLSHHSLKKRIKMMHKNSSNRWLMTKGVVLPALMALAVVAFAKPKTVATPQDTQDSSEKLVTFKQGDPSSFAITIPKGANVERKYKWIDADKTTDKKNSSVQEDTEKSPYFRSEDVTVKLDGKTVEPEELVEMPASAVQKVETNLTEHEINLVTTVEQPAAEQPAADPKDDDKIYDIVDENAQFPGGDAACYKWLADHIKYPKECADKGIQGRVHVQFVINKDGSIVEAKALRSPDDKLTEEALRCVNAMPKWKPAKVKGNVVRSSFLLPISFRLNNPAPATQAAPVAP